MAFPSNKNVNVVATPVSKVEVDPKKSSQEVLRSPPSQYKSP
jgi:hypothetical protein